MKVVSTEALTKLIQLVKSAFIKVEDVTTVTEIDTETTSEVTLATVATSGSYNDLSNKPTIPTDTSDLTNGAGYITSSALTGYATENYVDTGLSSKQDVLTAGDNITITNNVISAKDTVYTAGTDIEIVKGGSGGILPQGFQQVEYIEGNTNVQYIDTGIIPTSNMNIYAKAQLISDNESTSTFFFGGRTQSAGGAGVAGMWSPSELIFDWFGSSSSDRYAVSAIRTVGDVLEWNIVNSFITIKKNSTVVGTHQFNPSGTSNQRLYINGMNNGGSVISNNSAKARMYRFTIENVAEFIPAIRKSDNVVGMYDVIRNQFFTNAGTGSFIAGEPVKLPDGYKQVEYIESTGTQYIDTGVVPNQDTSVELDGSIDGYGIFFGIRTAALVDISTIQGTSTGYWAMGYNTQADPCGTKDANRHTWYKNKNKQYMDGDLKQNYTYANFTAMGNAYLFAYNNNGTVGYVTGTVRIYSCKIYDNGTLVRDFVPCLDANNVACMYDMVGKQTYYNAGTGVFEAGEVVGDGFVINFTNESGFIKSSDLTGYEQTSNKVTSLSSSSTDTEYPSAKCVYDIVGDIETLINAL